MKPGNRHGNMQGANSCWVIPRKMRVAVLLASSSFLLEEDVFC